LVEQAQEKERYQRIKKIRSRLNTNGALIATVFQLDF
jgi:hypothetical protein